MDGDEGVLVGVEEVLQVGAHACEARPVRVHVLQLAYGDDEPLAARVSRVADLVRAQAGADLVVLPELWPNGGFAYDTWDADAQALDGHVVTALRAATADLGAVVHMGSFVERDKAGRLFNTSVLLGDDGTLLSTYRKVHLFGFGEGEPKLMTPGDGPVVHGNLGLATCYDLRFPEMFRILALRGARLLVLPSAFTVATTRDHWEILVRARAIENQCFVVAPNQWGEHAPGLASGGRSLIDMILSSVPGRTEPGTAVGECRERAQ